MIFTDPQSADMKVPEMTDDDEKAETIDRSCIDDSVLTKGILYELESSYNYMHV